MKYYKIYTSDHVVLCYAKTDYDIEPEELLEKMGCYNCIAVPITKQCFDEFESGKYNDWDL